MKRFALAIRFYLTTLFCNLIVVENMYHVKIREKQPIYEENNP